MEQVKEYHINNSTIRVGFGNILDRHSEVIANSSGSRMTMGGGLTKAIHVFGKLQQVAECGQRSVRRCGVWQEDYSCTLGYVALLREH